MLWGSYGGFIGGGEGKGGKERAQRPTWLFRGAAAEREED